MKKLVLIPGVLACLLLASSMFCQAAGPSEVWRIDYRVFGIPLHFNEHAVEKINYFVFFYSNDEGKTWRRMPGKISPKEQAVTFFAPKDGTYWFALQADAGDNGKWPTDIRWFPPLLKVTVKTGMQPDQETPLPGIPLDDVDPDGDRCQHLEVEVRELREKVKQLEKRLSEAETYIGW